MNVYDFDNTIYRGDSTADFYFFCLKRHKKITLKAPSLLFGAIKFYVFKIGTKTDFKQNMYKFLQRVDFPKDLEDFWSLHKENIKPWYLKQQKDDDVIISASPYFLLKPICKELSIKHLIASNVNKHTGVYNGINCHGKEKVRLFNINFPNKNINEFYSDSKSDTPLAEIAEKAFIVHGDDIKPWDF